MIPAAAFLLGVGVTVIALVVVAWIIEARAESREMRRYSAMSAALSAVGTPRPNLESLRADAVARLRVKLAQPYLPESRDADFAP